MITIAAAVTCVRISSEVTPSTSPKSSAVTSIVKDRARDTITTPNASMPTKSSPMAVSSRTAVRADTAVMSPLITRADRNAPTTGLKPQSTAKAMPGMTPCANASPKNDRPRSTTHVPMTEVATTATRLARSARCMKVGSKASVKNSITRSGCQSLSDSRGVSAHHVDIGGAFGIAAAQGFGEEFHDLDVAADLVGKGLRKLI